MEAILVATFCALLFLFMRTVGALFGQTFGTLAGIGCDGVIVALIAAVGIVALLPVLVPIAAVAGCIYIAWRMRARPT